MVKSNPSAEGLQVLLSSDSVCVQYSCNSGKVMGRYNVTLASTKPPP